MNKLPVILFLSFIFFCGEIRSNDCSINFIQVKKFASQSVVNNDSIINLAANRPCKVFSFVDASDMSFKKLTDGKINGLAWSSNSFTNISDHSLYPEYVVIDLGKTCKIDKIILYPANENLMANRGFPEDFSIQVCREGEPWSTIIDKRGYILQEDKEQEFELPNIVGRYVKVEATKLSEVNPGNYMFQLSEIEVLGRQLSESEIFYHKKVLFQQKTKAVINKDETHVARLRCENRDNPIGVDVEKPRLSWWLESNLERGIKQVAYRILVATSKKNLFDDYGDLWDSGKKMGNKSISILYDGSTLKTGQNVFWKVMVWYSTNLSMQKEFRTEWSNINSWTCGKMKFEDWQGDWIGTNQDTKHGAIYLRKEIKLLKPVKRAMVYFCGLGFSELYINGNKVGEYLIGPGFTTYNKRTQYLTIDVSENFINSKIATLGVILVDGWYALERDPWVHKFENNHYVDKPKLLLNLHLEYDDGTESIVTSNLKWKWSKGEIIKSGIAYEDIDKRKALIGWDKTDYDDSNWSYVVKVEGPTGKLVNQKERPNNIINIINPVSMEYDSVSKTCIYDLGRIVTGSIYFKTSGLVGTEIKITPIPSYTTFRNYSNFTLAGNNKEEVYESRFFYHGMRKVKIEGITALPNINDLNISVISSIPNFSDSFKCSNDLVNWIHEAAKRTVLGYTTFLPNDPTREWKAWMEDPQNMFVSSVYLFDAQNMYERWQFDIIDGQREDGNSPNIAPGAYFGRYNSPWWGGCIVWLPWYWYLYYGDFSLLKKSYFAMKGYVDYLKTISSNGIQDWGLLDWQPVEETPRPIINTSAYYLFADIVAKTAFLMDNDEDYNYYSKLAGNIRDKFNDRFLDRITGIYGDVPKMFSNGFYEWNPRINIFEGLKANHKIWWSGNRTCTQAGQVLPLAVGIVPKDLCSIVEESLLKEIKAHNNRLSTGFVSTPYLLQIIGDLAPEIGWEITTAQDYPSWYSMTAGSNNEVMMENWAGGQAFMPSLGGNIAGWNYQFLSGILPDPSAPGFKKIIIKPNIIGDLHWVEGSYQSVYGEIISNWYKRGNDIIMEIAIPPNTTATVYFPTIKNIAVEQAIILEGGKSVEGSYSIRYLKKDRNYKVYKVDSGNYIFSVTNNLK